MPGNFFLSSSVFSLFPSPSLLLFSLSYRHFLKGICNKDNCPYSHVYVNEDAAPCPDFQNGYCPNGKNCKLKHIYAKNPKKEKEENEKNREKRRLEEGEEEEREKRRKIEEGELAKQIRPNFSAFFGASNNTGTPSE